MDKQQSQIISIFLESVKSQICKLKKKDVVHICYEEFSSIVIKVLRNFIFKIT